jgi:hypothetical protein
MVYRLQSQQTGQRKWHRIFLTTINITAQVVEMQTINPLHICPQVHVERVFLLMKKCLTEAESPNNGRNISIS